MSYIDKMADRNKNVRKGRRVLLAMDFYASDIVTGVARYAREAGWVLYDHSRFGANELPRWHGDGAIALVLSGDHVLINSLNAKRFPVINLSDQAPDWKVPRVLPDNEAIGRLVADEFIRRRFERFAYYAIDRRAPVVEQRLVGFRKAVESAGWGVQVLDYTPHWKELNARDRLIPWLTRELGRLKRPVAVMAQYDIEAQDVVYAALDAGLRIPADIAVIGADNDPVACELGPVPLSSVVTNREEQGYRAAELLDRLMKGAKAPAAPLRIAPTGLVVRQSSDIYAVQDRKLALALDFIAGNCSRPIGIDDVATAAGVSRRSLYQKFEKAIGRGVHDVIRERRLEQAKTMLRDTDLKVFEIADACCFADAPSLSKAFQTLLGMSPGKFREQYQRKR